MNLDTRLDRKPKPVDTEGLRAALKRLDRLLSAALDRMHTAPGPEARPDAYRGLYISREDVERILATEPGHTGLHSPSEVGAGRFHLGADTPGLRRITALFGLSAFETDLLMIALAPELDLRYEQLYAYLQDDVTRKRPSADLALSLLCPDLESKIGARRHLSPEAPLIRHRLLSLTTEPSHPLPPFLKKSLVADPRIVDFILGDAAIDAELRDWVRPGSPIPENGSPVPEESADERLRRRVSDAAADSSGLILYFEGEYGTGRKAAAADLCRGRGLGLLLCRADHLAETEASRVELSVRRLSREALLQDAGICLEGFDALLSDENRNRLSALFRGLEAGPSLVFLTGETAWEPTRDLCRTPFVRVSFARPGYDRRLAVWQRSLNGDLDPADRERLGPVADKFRFTGGQILDAAETARNLSRYRHGRAAKVGLDEVYDACRLHSNRRLSRLARKIVPRAGWEDIVLPADCMEQLRSISRRVRRRARVFDHWGFDRKLSGGKGINALFAGPSGTGKTMAAEIIARDLGLDLYKIDLSTVVSKYIGETEKNLSRIFDEAETANAILFFDEADALFGKRSEVKDSHDRYANIEISYLLQKMETFDGVAVLATNLRKNMDEAFVRRLAFSIHFPFPEADHRLRIWRTIWPDAVPISEDVDLDFMARRFRMTGGNIKNIALAAAFLAADDGRRVTMPHLIRATRQEFQKMGKTCVKTDFDPYYDIIAPGANGG
jgi:hypothetical protein